MDGLIRYQAGLMKSGHFWVILFLLMCSATGLAQNTLNVVISGVEQAEAKKNVEAILDISSWQGKSPQEMQRFFIAAPAQIKHAMQPFGYFKTKIQSSFTHQHNQWSANFHIILGPPIRISSLDLNLLGEGAYDPWLQKLVADSPLALGNILVVSDYNKIKKDLFNAALAHGYFDARYEQAQITIDIKNYTARVVLIFHSGIRYRFGQIFIDKNPLSSYFLKKFAPFSPHDFYANTKVEEFQQALVGSDYFKEVQVNPLLGAKKDHMVPIEVMLKPLPARQYNLGLGFGTDTGLRGLASSEWRRVTADGQRFKANLQASQLNTNLKVDYIIPGEKPATDKYVLTAMAQQQDDSYGKGALQKLVASYATEISQWQQTISFTLQRERSALENLAYRVQYMLMPSISWTRVSQDDAIRPSHANKIDLILLGSPNLFSNTAFWQGQLNAKVIFPLFKENRLLLRGTLGHTSIANINDLPLSLQFFAGGSQSIRGYAYHSIGPGSNMWVGSVEYRQHIKGDWYAAVFFDGGNITDAFTAGFKKSAGIGAVWQSPIGALALSMAQAQDVPGKPLAIQFSMGPDL